MRTHRILVPLIAALGLLLASCSDDDGGGDTTTGTTATTTATTASGAGSGTGSADEDIVEQVSEAAGNTVDQGTARFLITVESAGTGVSDGQAPIEVEGDVDFDAEQRRLVLVGDQGELEIIIDAEVAYVELPATEGDDWMAIDIEGLLDDEIGFGGPAAIPFQDPAENLRVLQGSVTQTSELGTEDVAGEESTGYELVIDLQQAAEDAGGDVQDAIEATVERTGLDELTMEVWIDDDDLIRRVAYTLDVSDAQLEESDDEGSVEADPQGEVTVTIEYTEFDIEVDIEVPDDADVVELDEDALRDAIGGGGSGGSSGGTGATTTTTDNDTTTTTSGATTTTDDDS